MRAVLLLAIAGLALAVNNRPVIGILDQPTSAGSSQSYIAASYVKWVEASGARVVPVHYNSTTEHLDWLFSRLNGFLYTGGGTDLVPGTKFYSTGERFYHNALRANIKGDHFPLYGTCMGFQFLAILTAEDPSVLTHGWDSYNIAMPLNFTDAAKTSRMFAGASPYLMDVLAKQDVTMNNHHWSVAPDTFKTNQKLAAFYNVLSINNDRVGKTFVSTFEARSAPVYAVQWHPEKNNFEWTTKEVHPHSADAVLVSQFCGNFFVNEARKSAHQMTEAEFEAIGIYNDAPEYAGKKGSTFVQEYYWGPTAGADQEARVKRLGGL